MAKPTRRQPNTGSRAAAQRTLEHFHSTFQPLLIGVALAVVLALLLRETGPAERGQVPVPATS